MDKDKLLQKYLDDELDPEEERQAFHIFADVPELRRMVRFDRKFRSSFREEKPWRDAQVPAGFGDRVMRSIQEKELNAPGFSIREWVVDQLRWMWQPHPVQWRPVYAVAVVLLVIAGVSLPYGTQKTGDHTVSPGRTVQPVSESADQVWLRFVFVDDDAQTVEVAGDFSDWEPIPLTKQTVNGEQIWTALVSMERGEHRYMFVKDGEEWVTDPLAPVQREDGFGNKNAVIYL